MSNRERMIVALGAMLGTAGCYSGVHGLDDDAELAGASGTDDSDPDEAELCRETDVAPTQMRRLTRLEYDNTVRDLLGDTTQPARQFFPDERVAGFAANAVAPLTTSQLDEFVAAAETLAANAVEQRWDEVVGCDPGAACADAFITRFGRRAFRRPLTEAQHSHYRALFDDASAQWGPTEAISLVLQAMLLSPNFLYHVEPGSEPGVAPLSAFPLASRLSYFVWASMPDDALLDAAEAGDLDETAGIEDQLRRMLEDDRASDSIASFHRQWLGTQSLADKVKDADLFPQWSPQLAASMEQETLRFADEVIRRGDATLHTLLTASWTVADARLAQLYGVDAPAEGFAVVQLPAEQRAGLLTHASFLTSSAHAAENSWVFRGKFVREQMLCDDIPSPPAGVEINEANDPDRLENEECGYCHILMDPIGQGFDAYDPVGAFDPAIDGAGEVVGSADLGEFDGAADLARSLAQSPAVDDCVAEHWFHYAARRASTDADACTLEHIQARFAESGGDIRELMVAIAVSDAFVHVNTPQ